MSIEIFVYHILPLYGLIVLGYIVGRTQDLDVKPIATLMLYAVLPVVMFGATATMHFTVEYFLPPLIIASISIMASTFIYLVSGKIWGKDDKRHNLLGMLGVSSNATYFGIPIAMAIVGDEWLSVYMMMVLPLFILDCTLSYYFAVRGDFTVRESIERVAKLPIIYGAILGFIVSALGFELSDTLLEYWARFTGTMVILGMMMIGAALARVDRLRFDWSFFTGVAALRYLIWPVLGVGWVLIDLHILHMLPTTIHTLIILICACPLAANNVAYAAKLDLHPALTAMMVMITTLIASAFIPLMMWVQSAFL